MTRSLPTSRTRAATALLAAFALAAAALAGAGQAGVRAAATSETVDTRLCGFPLEVTVTRAPRAQAGTNVLRFSFAGPAKITLRNRTTGRTATLRSSGPATVDTKTGSVSFGGRQVWFWAGGSQVPFLATTGRGALRAPYFVLDAGATKARVVDPCALVSASTPSTRPRATRAPWGLPADALARIAAAGLTPILGTLVRHDHVHLDVIVDGRRIAVPAGVGLAEPVDGGPCPPTSPKIGDCAGGHFFTAAVANSPLHTHSASGIVHIESDRPGVFTLGEFFAEWGVRLDARCLGGYCAGGGKQLRVYLDGKRAAGDPRRIVLANRQEIAVVYGGPGAFASVPATWTGGWPGAGCGGPGEHSCLP
jgi:hypothetical protein